MDIKKPNWTKKETLVNKIARDQAFFEGIDEKADPNLVKNVKLWIADIKMNAKMQTNTDNKKCLENLAIAVEKALGTLEEQSGNTLDAFEDDFGKVKKDLGEAIDVALNNKELQYFKREKMGSSWNFREMILLLREAHKKSGISGVIRSIGELMAKEKVVEVKNDTEVDAPQILKDAETRFGL